MHLKGYAMNLSTNLAAYAFVQDTLRKGGDFIEALAPLFAPIANRRKGQVFEPTSFANDLRQLSLDVHAFVIEDWAERMANAGLLTRISVESQPPKYIYNALDVTDVDEVSAKLQSIFDTFFGQFSKVLRSFNLEVVDRTRAEEMFFVRVRNFDFEAIASKNVSDDASQTKLTLEAFKKQDDNRPENTHEQIMDVFFAYYIVDLRNRADPDFLFLAETSLGVLAADVITSLRKPIRRKDSFSNLALFLDAPIILDLLGLGGDEDRAYAEKLYRSFKEMGGKLSTYTHCVEEVTAVVKTTLRNHENGYEDAFGPLGHKFRTNPNAVIYARSVLANPNAKIKDLGIELVQSGKADGYRYYSKEQEDDVLGQVRPFADRISAREFDAASIAETIRHVLFSKPVGAILNQERLFVSKNKPLCRVAERIIRRDTNLNESIDVPFIDDRYLGGLVWLATGSSVAEIPMAKIVANCTAAIRPRRDILRAAYKKMKEVGEEAAQTFEALMTDDRCSFYLTRISLGQPEIIQQFKADELLIEIKKAIAFNDIEKAEREFRERAELIEARADRDKENFQKQLDVIKDQVKLQEQQQETEKVTKLKEKDKLIQTGVEQLRKEVDTRRDERQEIATKLFDETANIYRRADFSFTLLVWVGYIIILPVLEDKKFLYGFISFALGSALFHFHVGSKICKSLLQNQRQTTFERKLRQLGLADLVEQISYNWEDDKITFLESDSA